MIIIAGVKIPCSVKSFNRSLSFGTVKLSTRKVMMNRCGKTDSHRWLICAPSYYSGKMMKKLAVPEVHLVDGIVQADVKDISVPQHAVYGQLDQ